MKTIEQLKAEHEKEIRELEKRLAIAEALPLPPHGVMLTGSSGPWVTYKSESISGALDIFNAYAEAGYLRGMEVRRAGCTVVQPVALMEKQYLKVASDGGEYGLKFEMSQGEGFGPTLGVVFFAEVASAGYIRVCIDVEKKQFDRSQHWKLGHVAKIERGYAQRIISKKFAPNAALNGYSDRVIKWGTGGGPIEDNSRFTYLFINDVNHIRETVGNIIAEFEGGAK